MKMRAPNILFITCDQLRRDALGCYGGRPDVSPHIDALAKRSARFEQAYVASPVCSPNRASWVTGCYPTAHGLTVNGVRLRHDSTTLMECLRQAGYQTAAAGKLHFEPQWAQHYGQPNFNEEVARGIGAVDPQPRELPYFGLERCAIAEDHHAGPYEAFVRSHGLDPWVDPHSAMYPQHMVCRSALPASLSKTTWIAERSMEFMRMRDRDKPLFLWCSFVHPHHPFVVPKPFDRRFDPAEMESPVWEEAMIERWPERLKRKYFAEAGSHEAVGMHKLTDADFRRIRAAYLGMVAHVDEQVGRVLRALEADGMVDDTIIVFSSDHGELLGDYHLLFKAAHYRCVTRVPLLVAHPRCAAGVSEACTSAVDLMPTLLEMAGCSVPAGVQGRSFAACVKDVALPLRDEVYIEDPGPVRTLMTPRQRITWHGCGERGEFYELDRDPGELVNRWDDVAVAGEKYRALDRLIGALALEAPKPVKREYFF